MSYSDSQPRDSHGRWAGTGPSGDAKQTVADAIAGHIAAVASTAAEGHAFAAQASEMAAQHLAAGQKLEPEAHTPEGAKAANAEYAAHADLKERATALESEASANDRNVRDLGRARDALNSGDTAKSARILDRVGMGESGEHDAFQAEHLKTEATGEARNSEHAFVDTHHGRLSLGDTLHNVHDEDTAAGKRFLVTADAVRRGKIR